MKVAIQGHPTRGKEVIQILKSLGGINPCNHVGNNCYCYYEIHGNTIVCACTKSNNYKYYTLEEFEKEFPFKVGDKVTDHEGDVAIITGFAHIKEKLGYSLQYENGRGTATPRMLTPYKEMKEERNITLTLDKAKEWYKKGGELKEIALQAFTEKELTKIDLPKTWEEFCRNYPIKESECWIGPRDTIYNVIIPQDRIYKNWIPSKKSAEAHLAMIQLEQLRNCWWNGWEPIWDCSEKWCIRLWGNELTIGTTKNISRFLTFPTKEMAEEFLKCFRDLIEKAGDLI